jgi:hypothetical protein
MNHHSSLDSNDDYNDLESVTATSSSAVTDSNLDQSTSSFP